MAEFLAKKRCSYQFIPMSLQFGQPLHDMEEAKALVSHYSPPDGLQPDEETLRKRLKPFGCRMVIFDKGKCAYGNPNLDIYPMEQQEELLPKCDVVILSGSTTINGTEDKAPISRLISQAAGMHDLGKYMVKKNVRIP